MSVELESLVAMLVGGIQVPPPGMHNFTEFSCCCHHRFGHLFLGGALLKFSLGAGDRQSVQPPMTATIPATQATVAVLFQQLGTVERAKCASEP